MTKPELFTCGFGAHQPKPYHYKECGLDNIFLLNGFTLEDVDGEEYVSIDNVDGLWKAIGINLVAKQKTFSPSEIRFLRSQMDLTQAELAKFLRVDDQTVARWEKKHCKMPGPADLALRFLFLSSEVAQPEGGEIVQRAHELIKEIVDRDEPLADMLHFSHGAITDSWEPQRMYA